MTTSIRTTQSGDSCAVAVVAAGEEVARLEILDRQMRLGVGWVRIAAIAGVKTKPRHRGQGYARELMQATVGYMGESGYAISILFGIPDFYHRFGYAPVMPGKSLVRIRTAAGEALGGALAVREAKPADGEALLEIYNAANVERTGTLARKGSSFSPWLDDDDDWWQEERRLIVAEDGGRPVAYALAEPEWLYESEWNMRPYEIGVLPEYIGPGTASLVRALAVKAAARRDEWLTIEMPADSPQLGVLRPVGFTQEIAYAQNQGGMGRITDLGGLATTLKNTLASRMRSSGLAGRVGKVQFTCDTERAVSEIGTGPTLTIDLPQQHLLQLLMGYRSIAELRLEFPACVDDQVVEVVDALLPAGHPYMWRLDHF